MTDTGEMLLAALRRSGSVSALAEVNPALFIDDEDRDAYQWLKNYVTSHAGFPPPGIYKQNTGMRPLIPPEPLSYWIEEATKRAKYQYMKDPVYEALEALKDRDTAYAEERLQNLMRTLAGLRSRESGRITLSQAVDRAERAYAVARRSFGLIGVTTGWQYLDTITAGWQNSDLISLVARPGRGKTYYLLYMAYHAWLSGRRVLFVSMEINAEQLARRVIGIHSTINPDLIRKGRLDTHAELRFAGSIRELRDDNGAERPPFDIVVGDFNKSVDVVAALAEELTPDIIYIDASYLILPEKGKRFGSRREAIADVIGGIKTLQMSINRPIVQTLQFNREAVRAQPRRSRNAADEENLTGVERQVQQDPLSHLTLEKIGETDVIGQASSIVLGLEKHPTDKTRRYMGVLKGREGEDGWWNLNYRFDPVDFSWRPKDDAASRPRTINLDYMTDH